MPLTGYAQYKEKVERGQWKFYWTKSSLTTAGGNPESLWLSGPLGGATPSTPVACGRDTVGALLRNPQLVSVTNPLHIAELEATTTSVRRIAIMVLDRLSHQGGLSGTATGEQTTNLPTAALTRYTDGVGVIAALQWYTATGSTAVTATIRYTNENGTGNRTSQAVNVAASRPVDTVIFVPTADGDRGVRSVEGVTLSASTGTAGNFGVTLYYPLAVFSPGSLTMSSMVRGYRNLMNMLPPMSSDACLDLVVITEGTSTGQLAGVINVIEVQ